MHVEIKPFHADMIPEAGELLAQRHQRHRIIFPELPPRFENAAVAQAAVAATWQRPHTQGMAAVSGGRLVGYLLGAMVFEGVWGRAAWMRPPGCTVAPDQDVDLIRDLYAALGRLWVDFGCFAHFALMPIADPALIHAWFSLSFGIEQVHALLDLEAMDLPAPELPVGVEMRRAGPGDNAILADLSDVIWKHQVQAPVWGIHLPESDEREGWAELADDPAVTVWLAFEQGQLVGMQGYFPAEADEAAMLIPDPCVHLTVAGTRESARGRGIGLALTRHGLAQARANGFRFCETDWRSTNLLASRFWPRRGFRPTAYRLVRRIDPRIAWANGQAGG